MLITVVARFEIPDDASFAGLRKSLVEPLGNAVEVHIKKQSEKHEVVLKKIGVYKVTK